MCIMHATMCANVVCSKTNRSRCAVSPRRERDVKAQLQTINRRRLESQHLPELDDDEEEDGAVDEEAEREAWLLQLDLYAIKVRVLTRFCAKVAAR